MGCCLSTTRDPASAHTTPDLPKVDRSPPPVDEETVKEVVLSETHISKPLPLQDEKKSINGGLKRVDDFHQVKVEVDVDRRGPLKADEEIAASEPSEMCSLTESISTTATEKRDDDGEVNQRSPVPRRKRRTPGDLPGGRQRSSFKSPSKRSAPSPEKRNALASSKSGQSRTSTPSRKRNVGPEKAAQREAGNARRSRSPAARREADPRRNVSMKSPAVSEGGQSPAKSAENHREDKKLEKPNDGVSGEAGESLENPLVSMECFIFL
ncbi:unnamed protein product [Cuscuta epithymum]|uniref:Serine/arginine repetitive matrix protein 1-like n=1 Tax=Cuscuta epithymum TaxID=186058 RepID=A0AAV0EBQ2_9ASTE|nr:unnamed protein product [Cuscuta epithymum]CAH9121226.1 unnamed protein product [Cuscuta epithymum]